MEQPAPKLRISQAKQTFNIRMLRIPFLVDRSKNVDLSQKLRSQLYEY